MSQDAKIIHGSSVSMQRCETMQSLEIPDVDQILICSCKQPALTNSNRIDTATMNLCVCVCVCAMRLNRWSILQAMSVATERMMTYSYRCCALERVTNVIDFDDIVRSGDQHSIVDTQGSYPMVVASQCVYKIVLAIPNLYPH
jgi:hypothetical protein